LAKSSENNRAPIRVLIVEDSEDDALLLLRELRGGGYEPDYERVDTPEAMREALASSASWDVIVSDYRMPRFEAPEALALARDAGLEAPFVVVSGKVGEEDAVRMVKAGAYDYVMKDNLTRLCATLERGLEEAEERRERRRAEEELRRRDAILEAVRFAAERLLAETAGWEESVGAVLRRLGEATGAGRVYIFENYVGENGEVWGSQRYEWVAPGISAQMDNSLMQAIPYEAAGYGRWMKLMSRGEPVYGRVREFPEGEQPELHEQGVVSLLIVPIFVEGRWWGQIGFDDCLKEREWSTAEVGALGAAAGTLGASIRRRRIEEELRGSEERYRAVIEQATDGIYLLDVDTKRILETNPSFQSMLGYTADELQGMEVYDFVAHPRENVDSTISRTLKQRRRLVGERKYRREDGSLIDVEVGVSVFSYAGKEVIGTIVRDVTERKRAEEALARSENRLRTIVETEPECVKVLACGRFPAGDEPRRTLHDRGGLAGAGTRKSGVRIHRPRTSDRFRGAYGEGAARRVRNAGVRACRVEGHETLARHPRRPAPRRSRRDRWAPRDNARHHRAQEERGGFKAKRAALPGGDRAGH
jgi:PAS domain S-box-containing protein